MFFTNPEYIYEVFHFLEGCKVFFAVIKRWSEAESFTIFENHVYTSKKNLTFAINFVATPFFEESGFFYATQAKVSHKFSSNSIFGSKFDFSYAKKTKLCHYCSKSMF